tara:strand:- start:7510 stop:7644 length:135 start_codon:yes stop_codon:yes gene_type:complete
MELLKDIDLGSLLLSSAIAAGFLASIALLLRIVIMAIRTIFFKN